MNDPSPHTVDTSASGLVLSATDIATLFPAYLRLDGNGTIRDAGPSLLHHVGPGILESDFFTFVDVELPAQLETAEQLRQHRRAVIVRLKGCKALRLRGLVLDRGHSIWLLLGHIPDLEVAEKEQPLRISDFSPTDGTLDMLLAAEMRSGLLQEIRAIAAELDEQSKQAEAANRAKSTFLTTMSHEIRTPMNAVLGVAGILAETDITPEQRKWLDVMVDSGRSLMELLNNILDLSKIESGSMEINPTEFDLCALAKSVHALYAPVAAAKGVKITLKTELAGVYYLGDPVRIRQILSNLVGNAVKFTEVGEITITVGDRSEGATRYLDIAVSDTGIGISSEALSRLFDVFVQADTSTTRRYGGTGLGLSISKLLIEQMGGHITVKSRLGRGSAFNASMPIELLPTPVHAPVRTSIEQGQNVSKRQHILIVDDNTTNRMILSHYLSRMGHSFDAAENGQKALAAWDLQDYDVILMDIEMPVLDGVEATREIRRREKATARNYTPIIALSADAMLEKREAAFSVGMDHYLTKPVDPREIEETVQIICARTPPQADT